MLNNRLLLHASYAVIKRSTNHTSEWWNQRKFEEVGARVTDAGGWVEGDNKRKDKGRKQDEKEPGESVSWRKQYLRISGDVEAPCEQDEHEEKNARKATFGLQNMVWHVRTCLSIGISIPPKSDVKNQQNPQTQGSRPRCHSIATLYAAIQKEQQAPHQQQRLAVVQHSRTSTT